MGSASKQCMKTFEYYNPTRVVFGLGVLEDVGTHAGDFGKTALVVSYENQDILKPIVSRVEQRLSEANIRVVTFYEITPNPLLSQIQRAVSIARDNDVDMVIAVGGGSAMDSAKIIAAGFHYPYDIWSMIVSRHDKQVDIPPKKALPIIMIPTLPATSSEMNCGAVITNDATTEKSYVFNSVLFPRISIIDPTLTVTLPAYQTALGIADAISHGMETFLNVEDEARLQRRMALSVILTLMELARGLMQDPTNLELRARVQWAAALAWNGWTNAGAPHGSPMHQIGHVISAFKNVPHGATLSIIMPAYMKYTHDMDLDRYVELASGLFSIAVDGTDRKSAAMLAIEKFELFLQMIEVPTTLQQVGIGNESLESFTDKAVEVSILPNGLLDARVPLCRKDIHEILFAAM